MGKRLKQIFTKENEWIANKHMKRCSTSLAIRKIKATVRCHFTSIRAANILKRVITPNSGQGAEQLALSSIPGGNVKW